MAVIRLQSLISKSTHRSHRVTKDETLDDEEYQSYRRKDSQVDQNLKKVEWIEAVG